MAKIKTLTISFNLVAMPPLVKSVLDFLKVPNECQTTRPLDNSPLIFNMKTPMLRWKNIFLCSESNNFLKEEESLFLKYIT